MMEQIATLLAELVSLVLFWVWGSTIRLFICYSKVCVGISTPTRGVSALTKICEIQQDIITCLNITPVALPSAFIPYSCLHTGCGTPVKMHEYDYPVQ